MSVTFNGVKVFSATMHHDRDVLGEKVTAWMIGNPGYEVVDVVITQSSDQAFHCITITVFYLDPRHVTQRSPVVPAPVHLPATSVQPSAGRRLKFGAEK